MKKQIKSLLLVAVFACTTLPAWSQASTEGKEFWVANTIVCQPPSADKAAFPTVAVSAQKACTVTITDYNGNQLASADVTAGSWTRFGDNTAAVDPAEYYLDPSKWYPTTNNVNATDVYQHADKINNYGLHITATENVSVYVIMRTPQYSMDASNALPITALQAEYYLQDFYPDANGVDKPITMTTILATENNTDVVITPRGNTYGKNNSGTPYTISLNKGQTYYLISEVNSQLAGTHITAKDGKKIAVYVGSPVTRLPGGVAARDGLFEQMMPIDYWGTQFIATRSLQKDANIIGITATTNGTELKIDGYTQTYINEGDTYYILLQGPADPYSKNQAKITCHIDQIITADAAYIETSCPCAVISYDTGNSFAGAANSEIVNGQGDPSSVWMSPIQQKINRITFGACYTKKTQAHFLNVVTETATCSNTKLTAYNGQAGIDWSDKLSWTPVSGNSKYSYARVQIGNNTANINVFTLENERGFIAHVYGNGEDESYAYSAGSAAVEYGVTVDGETFTEGRRSDTKFCMGTELEFDAQVGTSEISRVAWDFGDGTTDVNGKPLTTHTYNIPGWYDVTANLYGHQVCTDEDNIWLGTVSFTFRIWKQDTAIVEPMKICLDTTEWKNIVDQYGQDSLDNLLANPKKAIVNPGAPCYDTIKISVVTYGLETTRYETAEGRDSVKVNGVWYYPETLPSNGIITWEEDGANEYYCKVYVTCYAHITTCLDLTIPDKPDSQIMCLGGEDLPIGYRKKKGDIDGKALFTIDEIPSFKDSIVISNLNDSNTLYLRLDSIITKPGYYTIRIAVNDLNCPNDELHPEVPEHEYKLNFTVRYPADIFKFKFNNVLAVYQDQGYTFTHYQWYRNGAPIGGDESILYLGENVSFNEGDIVWIKLTDNGGMELESCPQTISYEGKTVKPNNAPARKVLQNQRIYILRDEQVYDMFGQKVK